MGYPSQTCGGSDSAIWARQCASNCGGSDRRRVCSLYFAGLAMFAGVWQAGGMKKQSSDQAFHDRRYQERKRAEAERKVPKKKVIAEAEKKNSHIGG